MKKGEMRKIGASYELSKLKVGERLYIETTLEKYGDTQRQRIVPRSRRPDAIKDWEFVSQLFTAVSNSKAGDIRYVVCIERTL